MGKNSSTIKQLTGTVTGRMDTPELIAISGVEIEVDTLCGFMVKDVADCDSMRFVLYAPEGSDIRDGDRITVNMTVERDDD